MRRSKKLVAALALAATSTLVASTGAGAAPAGGRTVHPLVAQMTLDEKLSFVHWTVAFTGPFSVGSLPGVPRLGIPEVRSADGPAGIRLNNQPATAMPAPVALASTFDDELARKYGEVMGRDGRALQQDVVFGPMMNIIRVPHAGRNFETFSEDPLVSARTAAAQIKGIQSQGLIATAKHYAANNQETNRQTINVTVDEQTLREIELPAFEASVKAGVSSVMCAYNKVNGTPSCGHQELLTSILREQWGFQGWVMSDWLATHSTEAISKGLDQELGIDWSQGVEHGIPGGLHFGKKLKEAVQGGQIPVSTLDRAVSRIVGQLDRHGLIGENPRPRPSRDLATANAVTQQVAEAGGVLLRNQNQALPLLAGDASIAVIGPRAKDPKVTGLGSAHVVPDAASAPFDTIKARAGKNATVTYAAGEELIGSPIPTGALTPAFPTGTVLQPGTAGQFYEGTLTAPVTGDYRIAIQATGGFATVQIGEQTPIEAGEVYGKVTSAVVRLTAGTHKITMSGSAPVASALSVKLSWVTPEAAEAAIAEAVQAAKTARTAVVFAYDDGMEGYDRANLSLPGRQNKLITEVAKANSNTVVVLNTGSAITMPWLDRTAAVLDMWYPGQTGAEATTALLFGDTNPSGKLTQTFPADENSHPVANNPERFPGVGNEQKYTEGIQVGYRWYDKQQVKPLFPFGHGLSYTSFAYTDLATRTLADGGVEVSFSVRNTGNQKGKEVPQVYLGASPLVTVPQAEKALAGYTKVELLPGETKRVTVKVEAQRFKHWNAGTDRWVTGGGPRQIQVGGSSDKLPLKASVLVKP